MLRRNIRSREVRRNTRALQRSIQETEALARCVTCLTPPMTRNR
jgi:hypothetical protein